MRHHSTLRRTLTAVCATTIFTLGLAGCAATSTESDSGAESEPTATAETATPLYEYLAVTYPTYDDDEARANHDDYQAALTTCMTEQGFSYVPEEYASYSGSTADTDDAPFEDRNTEAWVAEYGYGLTQVQEEYVPDETATVDPNNDYVDSLDGEQSGAYYAALYGEYTAEATTWEAQGCQGVADHAVSGEFDALLELHSPILSAAEALSASFPQTPELVALDAEWAACMSTAGYTTFSTQPAPYSAIFDESQALYLTATGMTEDARLELQGREIPLALADFRCSDEVDYLTRSITVQAALEDQFVIDNEAELDALVADFTALA
ncbi:hypothetical protein D6T64_20280 [Cryobacterium melibiosiphilum]|uniref:Uncharacterized protein n=1 Tax=Cryobacterium melibiosiphilum TaxID=995039 RepID=A0A3A5MHF0_9MICO|nr:hypothetical protein [Cryobacterium melibiosiphilum]RJT85251.1 hypothetical protein D6T64_20280 [Cryobacterium melibiosiphilum]